MELGGKILGGVSQGELKETQRGVPTGVYSDPILHLNTSKCLQGEMNSHSYMKTSNTKTWAFQAAVLEGRKGVTRKEAPAVPKISSAARLQVSEVLWALEQYGA